MNHLSKLLIALFLVVISLLLSTQSSLAASTQKFSQGKIKKQQAVLGAKAYNVYYKESHEGKFTHAVRLLPASFSDYTINFLKRGTPYTYLIAAVDERGKEFWRSAPKTLPLVTLSSKK